MSRIFGFGFDAVDQAHRPAAKVQLECVQCGSTDSVQIMQREARSYETDLDPEDPRNYAAICPTPACRVAQAMAWDRQWLETRMRKLDGDGVQYVLGPV
jgi:hypothetical protein